MNISLIDKIRTIINPQTYRGEKSYIDNILIEYKNKRPNYEEFRSASHKAIEALLKEQGYKYQILSRTKTPERLKEKLIRKKEAGIQYNSLDDIEDLVGLRIIFYTEHDKEKFIKKIKSEMSGLLKVEEIEKDNGYQATHIIMSFGPKRIKLSEYKHFNNLKSEIQITSILHHAWAEIEHDLIYKDINGLKNRDPEKFEIMKHRMTQLMERYIKKAALELEDIINEDVE
ncbi:MAG: RelA/SpoT domain-containing protein [Candidatus Nomurabacteria bacterium GW2011_GWF2_35_66]|uniref:RelA/SpoT domain-containing protein n=1 Tax=Candidatus Nomurabacteria bacterium GW2011_GWE1_35_16 TaxID=1618761 RepID=A0A0G0DV12_9BACT|nr:MAG: RelA/SpoT domain-containing protein [Candidatus Nomurabacteria bacterium GW2011_GWF1_34_20]KKP63648.1 MAG: RelA/SpoT domain-containing protein [Candidatus Nomurabacteria bacterium GW2011_GWE2_34_25]KKP66850.1 MAG: RelA/SpoT domain-containing protein [Candidatus Nomurabacteria bacterium GW2011_GWE1_35_16]KKP83476.1 MAG: RelA/SpoT domain-containing protein [Candidatus Nomurabacteria bacterium GW2011_GWF2_35_66]HAE36592.1 hypothetical protein [Candidatus Nomurabacteria bacterium]